jgi:hypothetical protein
VGEKAKRFLVVVVKVIVPAECVADAIFLVSIMLRTLVAGYVVIGTAAFAAGATKILRVDASTADARIIVPTRLKAGISRTDNYISGVIIRANESGTRGKIEGLTPRKSELKEIKKSGL